ncbi:hypothetical protein Nmel_000793 [Mimus melanotis]
MHTSDDSSDLHSLLIFGENNGCENTFKKVTLNLQAVIARSSPACKYDMLTCFLSITSLVYKEILQTENPET